MSHIHAETTITLEGDEVDVRVRAYVEHHKGPGHWGYRLDGDAEVFMGTDWYTPEELDLDAEDVERVTDAILDAAETEERSCA